MNEEVIKLAEQAIRDQIYKKNISYFFRGTREEFDYTKRLAGSAGMSAWMLMVSYQKAGSQLHVSKAVSDDLIASEFSGAASVADVHWPSSVMEIYFEDPLLPTILMMKSQKEQIEQWIPFVEVEATGEFITAAMQEGSGVEHAQVLSIRLHPSQYNDFLATGTIENMPLATLSHELSPRDNAVLCYMMHLVFKVFAFASIPRFAPVRLSRKEMHFGGKPGVKGRPERPSFRVVYLPRITYPKTEPVTTSAHEFLGRIGHIRWYKAERYVNRKGTWDFIPPVPNPKTGKYPERKHFKVR
jgi:hypothetical protein